MVGYPTSGSGQLQFEKSGTLLGTSVEPTFAFSPMRNSGQTVTCARQLLRRQIPPIVVISRAGPLAGDHRRTERMPWRTFFSECRALSRLDGPSQHVPGPAQRRFLGMNASDMEPLLGVK